MRLQLLRPLQHRNRSAPKQGLFQGQNHRPLAWAANLETKKNMYRPYFQSMNCVRLSAQPSWPGSPAWNWNPRRQTSTSLELPRARTGLPGPPNYPKQYPKQRTVSQNSECLGQSFGYFGGSRNSSIEMMAHSFTNRPTVLPTFGIWVGIWVSGCALRTKYSLRTLISLIWSGIWGGIRMNTVSRRNGTPSQVTMRPSEGTTKKDAKVRSATRPLRSSLHSLIGNLDIWIPSQKVQALLYDILWP